MRSWIIIFAFLGYEHVVDVCAERGQGCFLTGICAIDPKLFSLYNGDIEESHLEYLSESQCMEQARYSF